ncbi:MAG: N-acetyltransferase family protein [Sphingobacteriales bacterium]
MVKQEDRDAIVAGGRYIVEKPSSAEVAFVVVDDYQGQGIGAILLRHLAALAREAGLKEFTAEVLPDNTPMLKVFERSGLKLAQSGLLRACTPCCNCEPELFFSGVSNDVRELDMDHAVTDCNTLCVRRSQPPGRPSSRRD